MPMALAGKATAAGMPFSASRVAKASLFY